MFCSKCGEKAGYGERFCSQCGFTLESAAPQKKGRAQFTAIVLGIVVLIGVVAIAGLSLGGGSKPDPEPTLRKFMDAWVRYDTKVMAELCGEAPGIFQRAGKIEGYTIEEVQIFGDHEQAKVNVNVSYRISIPGQSALTTTQTPQPIYLINKDGKWFIDIGRLRGWIPNHLGLGLFPVR